MSTSRWLSILYTHLDRANKLKMNSNKTEFLHFGTRQMLQNVNITSLSVAGIQVHVTDDTITKLTVMFESSFSMTVQINKMDKTWLPIKTRIFTYLFSNVYITCLKYSVK